MSCFKGRLGRLLCAAIVVCIAVGICLLPKREEFDSSAQYEEKDLVVFEININENDIMDSGGLLISSRVDANKYLEDNAITKEMRGLIWEFVDQLVFVETVKTEVKDGGVLMTIVIPTDTIKYIIDIRTSELIEIQCSLETMREEGNLRHVVVKNRYTSDELICRKVLEMLELYP